jgi:DNA-binding CsgD family transcriptional regulator
VPASDHLERARDAYAGGAWLEADEAFAAAERAAALEPADLERFATAAYMLGRAEDYRTRLERAHLGHLDAGERLRAVRCAFWIGVMLVRGGEMGPGGGWLARGRRLLDAHADDCVERAYFEIPEMFQLEAMGDYDAAAQKAAEIVEQAQRFGDADLFALAIHAQGSDAILAGRVGEGLRLLDEAMVAVTTGELSPIPSGIVYCGVIVGCQAAREVRRAREWTAALSAWCERQPDMVAFSGTCLVHRAEILQLGGAWAEALEEARRAEERCAQTREVKTAAEAAYRRAELHRLRGDLGEAERLYREAAHGGREPQPGLALLRLVQGDTEAAAAALRRLLAETTSWSRRAELLPAAVEVMLASGDLTHARTAAGELAALADLHRTDLLAAAAAEAEGAVTLAGDDAAAALGALRRAGELWQSLGAPYEAARVRALVARACRNLGDEESAALELAAAHDAFAALGASPEAGGIEPPAAARSAGTHGLTVRELEVLRLVAAGATNKAIAAELVLSERTVDRHVSNILAKLRVPSRSAATAYAYENDLV